MIILCMIHVCAVPFHPHFPMKLDAVHIFSNMSDFLVFLSFLLRYKCCTLFTVCARHVTSTAWQGFSLLVRKIKVIDQVLQDYFVPYNGGRRRWLRILWRKLAPHDYVALIDSSQLHETGAYFPWTFRTECLYRFLCIRIDERFPLK